MKTTIKLIKLFNGIETIATSTISFNPLTLIECYIDFIDNPNNYILTISVDNSMGATNLIITNGISTEWNVVVEDDWFEATGVDIQDRAELIEYIEDCIRTELEIDEANRAWA